MTQLSKFGIAHPFRPQGGIWLKPKFLTASGHSDRREESGPNFFALLFCCLVAPFLLPAQPVSTLKIIAAETDRPTLAALFSEKKWAAKKCLAQPDGSFECPVSDSIFAQNLLVELVERLREKGYLLASADSFFRQKQGFKTVLFIEKKFACINLKMNPETKNWLHEAGFADFEKRLKRGPAELFVLEKKLLQHVENQGFAFARVALDSLKIDSEKGELSGILTVWPGPFFEFGELKIEGDAQISNAYLSNFLGIRPGSNYRFSQVQKIRSRLLSSPFLEPAREPTVSFLGDRATVNIFLKKKRASRFDFLLGLLPRPAGQTDGPNLLLTGQFNAEFQNALGQGERLFAEIQRLRPETQRLDLEASWPWILGQPFGADGRLHLYKRDSTWLDFRADAGVQYLFEGGDFLKLFWESRSSNLLKINELQLISSRLLPANLDTRANTWGLETNLNRLDYRFNPRAGWELKTRLGAGFKRTIRNSDILKLDDAAGQFSAQYDSLAGRSAIGRGEIRAAFFQPIFRRTTLKIGLTGGGIFSQKPIFQNEQTRLGGAKLMRGYDEESIFGTRFLVGTIEWRLIIGENSHLAAFADYGYIENLTNRVQQFLHPLGLGAGMTFETKAGVFGLSLAVGRPENGGIDFQAAKIHIGYVSLF